MKLLFSTTEIIATKEIAYQKCASLLNLQQLRGCADVQNLRTGANAGYESPHIFNQLLYALNEVIEEANSVKGDGKCLHWGGDW